MKAVIITRYGGPEVLEYKDVAPPKAGDGEVVVRVRASNVNPIDWRIRNGELKLWVRASFPITLGVDLAGEIATVGPKVTRFSVGDEVFAKMPRDLGAQAELVAISERLVARKPRTMSMQEAATVPSSSLTALQSLRDLGRLQAGQRALINGASGGVGMFGVQIAKALGASVTAVCSESNFDLVKGLGADVLVDYKKTDFTASDEKYDVVFDAVANRSFKECKRILAKGGAYVTTIPTTGLFLRQAFNFLFSTRAHPILVKSSEEDLEYVKSLIEEGRLRTVVDKVFPITDVAEAQRYSATGRAKGKIVLELA